MLRKFAASLFDSFEVLDRLTDHYESFHLIFLIKLSRFLGFGHTMLMNF